MAAATAAGQPSLKLTVNGESMAVQGVRTVADLLDRLDLGQGSRVAVAVNTQVVPRTEHARQRLSAGDCVEIIHAVGGG